MVQHFMPAKPRLFAFSLVLTSSIATATWPQEGPSLDAEIGTIDSQITAVEETLAQYDDGLIRALAQSRREALLLLRAVVESRKQAEDGYAAIEVAVPAVEPDPERAEQILGEMATQQQRVEAA
jgi:hypothetical protein